VLPIAYETSERARLIMDLLLKELDWSDGLSLPLLRVGDRRLQSIVDGILANPGGHNSLTGWARHVGASPRTIARSCRRELGMPFVQVRRHLRLQAALPRIADGEPITAVALDVGYDTAAAFSSAFTRCLGMPPSQFFEKYSDKAVQPQLATIRRANL
jgi:AraC-like DNA-binding protein